MSTTRWQHGNIAVADDSCASGQLVPAIQQSIRLSGTHMMQEHL